MDSKSENAGKNARKAGRAQRNGRSGDLRNPRWRGLWAMTSVTKTERESDFGTARKEKMLRGIEKSPSEVETARESGRLRRKRTISRKGASIANRKSKGVEEDAKKRPCRRESRPSAVRNRSMSRIFENGASRAFSAQFDHRKRFAASNNRSRNFERSETSPESPKKRRFRKGAPTRSDADRTSAMVRRRRRKPESARRSETAEEFANKAGAAILAKMARMLIVVEMNSSGVRTGCC